MDWTGHQHGKISVSRLLSRITLLAVVASGLISRSIAFFLPIRHSHRNHSCSGSSIRLFPTKASILTKTYLASTSLNGSSPQLPGSPSWSVISILGREEAQSLLEDPGFLPSNEYGDRIVFGRQAAEKEYEASENEETGIMLSDDPRLARTYAEFPLTSLDQLLDKAMCYLPEKTTGGTSPIRMVDIGSGLGRIVLYSALTRGEILCSEDHGGGKKSNWEVRGIEISSLLHGKALEVVQTGIDRGILEEHRKIREKNDGVCPQQSSGDCNVLSFHCGSATDEHGQALLKDAHMVFAYSTAFKATGFDPDVGALILDTEEWSLPLREACPNGCVVVTTDRALNPNLGWKVVERIEVPNPEVLGTTGFIHVLEK